MKTFEQHLLKSYAEIEELATKIGPELFHSYRESVFALLRTLRPGDVFDIEKNVRPENIPVFIKCCCYYMRPPCGDCNILFSDDYLQIKGIETYNEGRRKSAEYQEQVKRMKQGNMYEKK